ncbi:uromodulin-like isoform X2 [Actinia tenebrosa]|uniref:Uromodulin-like isoform X2 n=1 Tax=Actinia tenebrosa TaxID=6105 RepID=A0A6P8J5R8_ACTTE|nr:uromodulin-like isoform X2 [Actinia tenebrosa]
MKFSYQEEYRRLLLSFSFGFDRDTFDIQQQTTQVPDKMDCVFACVGVPWCRSMNFQTTAHNNGLHVCELLSTDKHTHQKNMTRNDTFIHFSIKNQCIESPCLNGGTCSLQINRHDYHCQCKKGYHGLPFGCSSHANITDATRNVNNANTTAPIKCDKRIALGWYRFSGAAGVRMPTNCVPTSRCSTHASGWLSDPHPTIEQGTTTMKVCFHWSKNCCNWSRSINVTNCGEFFIYQFVPTLTCSLRYCSEH